MQEKPYEPKNVSITVPRQPVQTDAVEAPKTKEEILESLSKLVQGESK